MTSQRNLESVIHNLALILLEETQDKADIVHMLVEAGLDVKDLKQFDLEWLYEKYGF